MAAYQNPSDLSRVTLGDHSKHVQALSVTSDETQLRRIRMVGASWFIDMLGLGYMLEELAIHHNVRPALLADWLLQTAGADQIEDARQRAAAYYRIKALRLAETHVPTDRTELGHNKLLSDNYRMMAEALSPGDWFPNRNNMSAMGVAQISITLPDTAALGGVNVSGPGLPPPITLDQANYQTATFDHPQAPDPEALLAEQAEDQALSASIPPDPAWAATPDQTQPSTPDEQIETLLRLLNGAENNQE